MFESKNKEPKLSSNMEDIINRSIDEKNNSNIDDIFRYKYKIMKMLTSNQDILRTLHNDKLAGKDEVINGDLYRDVCIFDFLKLPDLKDEVKNYICFEINDTCFGDMVEKRIVFRTVSHKDDHKTDWGISRQDLLASILKNEFDWTNVFGMHLEKERDSGSIADDEFYYREIVYKTKTSNNSYNKINNNFKKLV